MTTGFDNSGKRGWARWLYPLALAVMIVIASGRSQVAAPAIINLDKLVHFSIFGLLATLVVRAPGIRHFWWALVIVSLFGIGDELRQSFTPGRSVEMADWLADTSGAAVAVVFYTTWSWYRRLLEAPLRLPSRRRRLETPGATAAASGSGAVPVAKAARLAGRSAGAVDSATRPPAAKSADPLSASR